MLENISFLLAECKHSVIKEEHKPAFALPHQRQRSVSAPARSPTTRTPCGAPRDLRSHSWPPREIVSCGQEGVLRKRNESGNGSIDLGHQKSVPELVEFFECFSPRGGPANIRGSPPATPTHSCHIDDSPSLPPLIPIDSPLGTATEGASLTSTSSLSTSPVDPSPLPTGNLLVTRTARIPPPLASAHTHSPILTPPHLHPMSTPSHSPPGTPRTQSTSGAQIGEYFEGIQWKTPPRNKHPLHSSPKDNETTLALLSAFDSPVIVHRRNLQALFSSF